MIMLWQSEKRSELTKVTYPGFPCPRGVLHRRDLHSTLCPSHSPSFPLHAAALSSPSLALTFLYPSGSAVVPLDVLSGLNDWYKTKNMLPVHDEFISNMVTRFGKIAAAKSKNETVRGGRHLTPPPLILDLSVYLANMLGRQMYETLSSLLGLLNFRTMQLHRSHQLRFSPGLQRDLLATVAPRRFGKHWLVSSGDGTRISRFIERLDDHLVGVAHDPNFVKWPTRPGFPTPLSCEDLSRGIRSLLSCEGDPQPRSSHRAPNTDYGQAGPDHSASPVPHPP